MYGRSTAKLEQNLAHGLGERTIDRAPTGAFVASAAKTLSYVGDVKFAFAAQADAVSPIRQLPEKRRHLDAPNREHVIHQPFAVFFNRAAAFHLLSA